MDRVNSVQELIERTQAMPLEKMRFFINENRQEPRCFGIYQDADSGHWVVYKNKDNGSRAVRYSGPDEAYAAQELWAKIQSEIELRRAKLPRRKSRGEILRERARKIAIAVIVAILAFMALRWMARLPNRGYYRIDDQLYYFQDDIWYYFIEGGDWEPYDEPVDYEWYAGNYCGEDYDGFADYGDAFENSGYYEQPDSSDSDSDDDSDLGSIFDSWSSSDTDWSSDW